MLQLSEDHKQGT